MSKELDKFTARRKAMQTDVDTYSVANFDKEQAKMRTLKLDASAQGEEYLAECMVKARKNGVTGDKLTDFMNDKDFQDGVKVMTLACKNMDKGFAAGKVWGEKAATAHGAMVTLAKDMDKDLKGRRDKSESKAEIQELRDSLTKEMTRLGKAATAYTSMHPTLLEYPSKLTEHIARILKQAPDAQERQSEINNLPQALVDRNRKSTLTKALARLKEVKEAGDRAIGASDRKTYDAEMVHVHASLTELKGVHDAFLKAVKHVGNGLDGTKDEKAVKETAATIIKAYGVGEAKLSEAIKAAP